MKKNLFALLGALIMTTSAWAFSIEAIGVHSAAMNKDVMVSVITPDTYNHKADEPYDIVYLLNGYGGNHESWYKFAHVGPYADQYGIIIVCPDGNNSWYWDSPVDPTFRYETFVAGELVAWVDANYHTKANRTGRAITGLSMGGHGALWLAIRHQDTFGAVGSTSGGVDIRPFPKNWEMAKRLGTIQENPHYWEQYTVTNLVEQIPTDGSLAMIVDCGTEDFFYKVNCEFHAKLTARGVPHDFYVRPGKHNWEYWPNSIKFQLLFFDNYFKSNKVTK